MRWGLLVIASIGCGRIAFDPSSGDAIVVGTADGTPATWLLPTNRGTATPCTFATAFHDACDHPAEHLVARVADATADCGKLELGDDLHAFDWSCRRDGGELVFQSLGLAAKAGLSTLVDANGWKPNRFYARANGADQFASEPAVWWDNPVVPLADNSTTGAEVILDATHTIYVLASSRTTSGYVIGADYIGVVILPGAVLSAGALPADCGERGMSGSKCFIQSPQPHAGTWIEGELAGDGYASSEMGIVLESPQWATLRHVRVHGMADGVYVHLGRGVLVDDFAATRNATGFYGDTSNVTARHVFAAANIVGYVADFAGYHVVTDVRAYNNNEGVKFLNDAAGLISNVFTARNNGSGVTVTEARNGGSLHAISAFSSQSVGVHVTDLVGGSINRILSVNNSGDGLLLVNVSSSVISHVVVAHAALNGIEMQTCNNDLVVGHLLVGSNPSDCLVQGGTNPGLDSACGRTGSSGNLVTGISLLSSFVGGTATANEATLVDWSLPVREQAWGADGVGPLDPSTRGGCLAGATCHQWDYSLAPGDTVLHDAADTGTPSAASPFVPEGPCPPQAYVTISAANELCFPDYSAPCPRIYLANAIEMLDDHYGNDDGFCESNEGCIYLPHMTSYPERGTMTAACRFQDGAVAGVTLFSIAE